MDDARHGAVVFLLIAATAHAHGAVQWTRNPDDFSGSEGFIEVRGAQTSV
ncbi:type II toxin-antitoxin system VapC family toxin [Arachnia propionica]|nr:type II toxin-antitoxin system VapC family toxin [Arachnia propionica]